MASSIPTRSAVPDDDRLLDEGYALLLEGLLDQPLLDIELLLAVYRVSGDTA